MDADEKEEEARLNRVLSDVNGDLGSDPAAALRVAKGLEFSDDDSRYEDAYRRALDAADTDVILDLDSPAVLASFVGDDAIAAVTRDGRVLVWDVTSYDPVRVAEEPRIDQQVSEGQVFTAETAASDAFIVLETASGISSVDVASGTVQQLDQGAVTNGSVAVAGGGTRDQVLVYDFGGHALVWDVAHNRTEPLPRLGRSIDAAAIDPTGNYVAALVRGETSRASVWSVATGQQIKSTPLVSYLDSPQTVFSGGLSFTGTGSSVDPDDPVLLIMAAGLKTEASRWDLLHEAEPTPLGDENSWRQVYDVADLTTASTRTTRASLAGSRSPATRRVTVYDAETGTFQAQTAASQTGSPRSRPTRPTPRSSRWPPTRGTSSSTAPTSTRLSRCGPSAGTGARSTTCRSPRTASTW